MKKIRNIGIKIFSKKPAYEHLKDFKEEVLIDGKLVFRPVTIPTPAPNEKWWYVSLLIGGKRVEKSLLDFESWSLEDYKIQWKEGFERLKTNKNSCLVVNFFQEISLSSPSPAENKFHNFSAGLWNLFRDENMLYIQPDPLLTAESRAKFKKIPFNRTTCYEFIEPFERYTKQGRERVYWSCKYDPREIDELIEKLKK